MNSRRAFMTCLAHTPFACAAASLLRASSEATTEAICFDRMGRIYEALRRWQRAHGGDQVWPPDLAVLLREGFLRDPRTWSCPVAEQTGNDRYSPAEPHVTSDPNANPHSSFHYEFGTKPVGVSDLGELPDMTNQEAKLALLRTELGGRVPVLRCGSHGEVKLNLGADGKRYRSPLYWEDRFSEIRPEPYTMPWMVAHHPTAPGQARLPRAGWLGPHHIDLTAAANANPDLPWIDGVPQGSSLLHFIEATQAGAELKPIAFDARAMIQTTGHAGGTPEYLADRAFASSAYPTQSRLLPLHGARARQIHLLLATAFGGQAGKPVGEVILNVSGGGTVRILLEYAVHLGRWRSREADSKPVPAWTGTAYHSPLLFRSTVRDAVRLARGLRSDSNPGINALREHFDSETARSLAEWKDAPTLPPALRDRLLAALNDACSRLLKAPGEARPAETFRAVLARLIPDAVSADWQPAGMARLFTHTFDLPPDARSRGLESLQLRADPSSTASPFLAGVTLNPVL